jgi:hypothetical protein
MAELTNKTRTAADSRVMSGVPPVSGSAVAEAVAVGLALIVALALELGLAEAEALVLIALAEAVGLVMALAEAGAGGRTGHHIVVHASVIYSHIPSLVAAHSLIVRLGSCDGCEDQHGKRHRQNQQNVSTHL